MDVREFYGSELSAAVGPMAHLSNGEFGIECIKAGLGYCLTMDHEDDAPAIWTRQQADILREAGCPNFGINAIIGLGTHMKAQTEIILDIKPRFVILSAYMARDASIVKACNDAGILVCILFGDARHIRLMDAILRRGDARYEMGDLEGKRSGGHNGTEDTPELIKAGGAIELLQDAGKLVAVAGGIYCREKADEAFGAGADSVHLGSVAALSIESPGHPNYKKACFEATETVQTGTVLYHAVRSLVSPKQQQLAALEEQARGLSPKDPEFGRLKAEFDRLGKGANAAGLLHGDWENGSFLIGTCVEHINRPRSIAEISKEILPQESAEVA